MKTGKKLTRKALLYTIISSAILVQTTGFSWAAEANDYSLDQVEVTANRMPVKVAETAANVSVITHADIEKNHYRDLGEALQQVTGLIVTKQGSAGSEQYVSLNGDPHVVIMIDGRRMNLSKLPGNFGGRATLDMSSFPSLTMIDKIEVVKGAASALYGSDATGGVINIITRKGSKSESTLDINTGSWGTRNYTYTNQGTEQGWSWFLTAGKSNQDHFVYKDSATGQMKTMENSAFDQKNLTFRLDRELDQDHSLTLNFEHMNNHKGQPYMAAGRTLWGASLHYPYDYLNTVTNNWAITYNTKKDQLADSYVRIYQNYYSYNMNQYVGSQWSASKYNNNQQGLEWKDGWQLGDHQTLVGGAEWIKTKVDYPGYFTNKTIDNKAVYLEDRVAVSDKWTFTPGVRYDHQNMFGSKTTSRAAVNYAMDAATNLYLTWGQVFNAPTVDDLYWPAGGGVAGNPNLKPETGYTTTIGVNHKLSDTAEIKASVFKTQLDDAINWAPDASGVYVPSNVDKQRKRGIELEFRQSLSQNWSVMTGYSYVKVENKSGDSYVSDIKNPAPNGYRLGVTYTDPVWAVTLNGTGASGRNTTAFTSSHYWVWDAAVNYKVNQATTAYVKVNNLTNKAYETVYASSDQGAGGFPMPGRNYQFGIQYRF